VKIDVKGVPAGISATPWLPASKLQLQEEWSTNPPTFTVGEPVTRTLAIIADGLTAAQLPNLKVALPDGLKAYPDQPTLNDTIDNHGVTGVRQQKIALIPTRPGTLVLPALSLSWWNTDSQQLEVARLPQRRIDVQPAAQSAATTTAPPSPAAAPTAQMEEATATTSETGQADINTVTGPAGWWPWLSLALGGGWLVTLVIWGYQRRQSGRQAVTVSDDSHASLATSEQSLKKACEANDPHAARTALLDWAAARWPLRGPTSLTVLARRCPPSLATALEALDRQLYAPQESGQWRGAELWSLFKAEKPSGTAPEDAATALEPLYRNR
jgi:hypothetical protein